MAYADLIAAADRNAQSLLGGEPVTYRAGSGVTAQVIGIFDEPFLLAQGSAESGVEARLPTVSLILADLPSDPMTDNPMLTIRGVIYRVDQREPAEFGAIVLYLRKVV